MVQFAADSSDLVTKRSENQDSKLMRAVHIIGVSLDLGGNRRGVDMGPSAFRIAGLGERLAALGATVVDDGDLVAPIPETKSFGDPGKKYIREIAKVCEKLYKTSLAALEKGDFPLVLGGDHSLASGSVAATADFLRRDGKPLGLIWVDAHGDMRLERMLMSMVVRPGGLFPADCAIGR